ncbi:MAG: hypothetical protein HY835_00265 [Anaerolineae bacterium]|nr:hypothetical protein [Anaerolineae bacterium]
MSVASTKPSSSILNVLKSEILMGLLVALLSVLAAGAAYLGALSDSAESDANVEGQKLLSESNTEFLRVNQEIIQDYTMFDGYYINSDKDEDLTQYYKDSFSDELTASMERPDGPFDDAYYTTMYTDADTWYDEAMTKFEEAQQHGNKADQFQLSVLIFAVGLALSAWASVINENSPVRPIFVLVALAALVFGLINGIPLILS